MERDVEHAITVLMDEGVVPTADKVKDLVVPDKPTIPDVVIPDVDLSGYDELLIGCAEVMS
jgi:hypothetical protein